MRTVRIDLHPDDAVLSGRGVFELDAEDLLAGDLVQRHQRERGDEAARGDEGDGAGGGGVRAHALASATTMNIA
jgi:hypothetical protein